METRSVKLTIDEDGLGADLLVATPFRTEPIGELLEALQEIDVYPRVGTLARGSKSWLLHLRVSESNGSRLSANRAGVILSEIARKLAAVRFVDTTTARAA